MDHEHQPLGQGDILPLAKWLLLMPCNPVVWGSKPARALSHTSRFQEPSSELFFRHPHCLETRGSVGLPISGDCGGITCGEDQQASKEKGRRRRDCSHLQAVPPVKPPDRLPPPLDSQPASQTSAPLPHAPFVLLPILLPVHKHVSCLCCLPANQFEAFI